VAYTYRFLDKEDNVIYVGYTGQTMPQRMSQHFGGKGHLPKECYYSVAKIEYIKWKTKCDAQVMEVYYINKYRPKFNKLNKKNDNLTIVLDEKEWKTYQVLKTYNRVDYKLDWLSYILLIALVYAVIQFIMMCVR
jgi:excinuclease UvrABC nuclease subunit